MKTSLQDGGVRIISGCIALFLLLDSRINLKAEEDAEPIPVRTPKAYESRPSWWWQCWSDHIVVVEGSIEFSTTEADRIKVEISPEAPKKHYERQQDRELQKITSTFYFGNLTIKKVLCIRKTNPS